jgi:hypothetical protein
MIKKAKTMFTELGPRRNPVTTTGHQDNTEKKTGSGNKGGEKWGHNIKKYVILSN